MRLVFKLNVSFIAKRSLVENYPIRINAYLNIITRFKINFRQKIRDKNEILNRIQM
jgi:hypothetical protein